MVSFSRGLLWWTMMLNPSTAMTKKRGFTPFSQAKSISFCFHSREWLAMSQVWLMIAVMPVPEPPPRTARAVPGFLAMYSSARIWTRLTIVSDPLIWIIFFWAGAAVWAVAVTARPKGAGAWSF